MTLSHCRPVVVVGTLSDGPGGSNAIAFSVYRELLKNNFEVHLCLAVAAHGDAAELPDAPSWVIGRIPRFANAILSCLSIWRMSRRLRPSLILSNGYGLNQAFVLARALRLTSAKVVIVEHGDLQSRFDQKSRLVGSILRRLTYFLYAKASHLVFCSTSLANRYQAQAKYSLNASSIPNAIDSTSFEQRSKTSLYAPVSELIASSPEPRILWVGRLSPEKNPLWVVCVMEELLQFWEASCFIVGDGPLRSDLELAVKSSVAAESIHLLGHIPDPSWLIRVADVVMLTSHTEGRPLILLEAMAVGTAIIAPSHISGVREQLENYAHRKLAVLNNPKEWAVAVKDLLNRQSRELPRRPLVDASAHNQMLAQYLALVRKTLHS